MYFLSPRKISFLKSCNFRNQIKKKLLYLKLKIKILEDNPFHTSLKTHKLKGKLSSCYACSINYEYRIVFKLCESELNCIELLNIGTHDEVY